MTVQTNMMGAGLAGNAARAILGTVSNALTANASAQGGQTLPISICVYTTVTLNNGPTLPAASIYNNVGDYYEVSNHGANSMNVWPPTGGAISTGSANAAFAVAVGKTARFRHLGSGNYSGQVG